MTNIVKFASPLPVMPLDYVGLDQAAWERDIAKHSDLMIECDVLSQRQTALMERIRTGLDCDAVDTTAFEYPVSVDFLSGETAEDQLAALDKRILALNIRMRRLEGSILTYEPETGDEAGMVLRFLARVLTIEHKVDAAYLADVLEQCAECMDPIWDDYAQRVVVKRAVH